MVAVAGRLARTLLEGYERFVSHFVEAVGINRRLDDTPRKGGQATRGKMRTSTGPGTCIFLYGIFPHESEKHDVVITGASSYLRNG
jgi:hypothetical protein